MSIYNCGNNSIHIQYFSIDYISRQRKMLELTRSVEVVFDIFWQGVFAVGDFAFFIDDEVGRDL